MLQPTDVDKIMGLYRLGWGSKRIAAELGISRGTVKKYLKKGAWVPAAKRSTCKLTGLDAWLCERFERHRGNADVIRQDLAKEQGITASLRTVQRAVRHCRQEVLVKAKATVRFETPPGKQLQIDFGSTSISIGGKPTRVYLFVATLGHSRRLYVAPFLHDRQTAWFRGMEWAFEHFGGVPEEVLLDNAKALVLAHPRYGEVVFNERLKAFAEYWGFAPNACFPYRARTKGKDERMVGYVKHNAIAGHQFPNWEALCQHLQQWNAEVADLRQHGTTEERPIETFLREEKKVLRPFPNKPSFLQIREYFRKVQFDACVEIDRNYYSAPAAFVGKKVLVHVCDGMVRLFFDNEEIASHQESDGRRERVIKSEHLSGIIGARPQVDQGTKCTPDRVIHDSELLRPLADYEAAIGGGW